MHSVGASIGFGAGSCAGSHPLCLSMDGAVKFWYSCSKFGELTLMRCGRTQRSKSSLPLDSSACIIRSSLKNRYMTIFR